MRKEIERSERMLANEKFVANAGAGGRRRASARSSSITVPSSTRWVESLSPWPADGFGLDRMRALLAELGDPQLRYPAVHVVGTNGKSTTTRLTEALLADAGLAVGAYFSPHVRSWSERIRIRGEEADFERAVDGRARRGGARSARRSSRR